MKGDFIENLVSAIVYLLPVLALVWKGAKLTSQLEHLEVNVKEKTDKFCKDHSEMKKKIEEEHNNTDKSIDSIMLILTDIQKSIVRIETKYDMNEGAK